ncbi:ribosomal protein S2 [Bifidobacterium gallicum DSM 20093 = LMG 11596]|uniref:Small ribosomal subunit protein uS2 n=1 Tax=Bifidobacterium gallicum DSM 20093 = LMG 11596 TaxID=561180 RepID=D1NTR1_9BIFI|nr:ribosomal protein S2 [Bifidobacterium gallicum DSM 20093 = LMG 11596]KFI58796.1 30S ribosomal protein S2 [Bifidobacterium gallicum DSM 20093 = LMG 11596]
MAQITMSEMLNAGLQFGHQTRRWNPKMKQYIITSRNGIHIIDLFKSLDMIDVAYDFIKTTVAHNGTVLFVGTKKQAKDAIASQATRVNMPYVSERWLGGMLTNFQTVSKRVNRLKELEEMDFTDVHGSGLTKKELLLLEREKDKLERQLGGIRNMTRTPSAMFVVDINKEALAVEEAHKLGIPVVAIVDTNTDPETVEYPIPANDDAIRGIELLTRLMADAVAEGLLERSGKGTKAEGDAAEEQPMAAWEKDLLKENAHTVSETVTEDLEKQGPKDAKYPHESLDAKSEEARAAGADAAQQAAADVAADNADETPVLKAEEAASIADHDADQN